MNFRPLAAIGFLFELLLLFFIEITIHLVSVGDSENPPDKLRTFFSFAVFGGLVGLLSCLAIPALLEDGDLQRLNLIFTPVLVGMFMAYLGKWRDKRGVERVSIDYFANAWAFAFTMSLMRHAFFQHTS